VPVLEIPDVEDVPVEHLHICYLKVSDTIDNNVARVMLLPAGRGIESRTIEKEAKYRAFVQVCGRLEKGAVVIDTLDRAVGVPYH
jgi:hypothetical protein